jgi:hypothetical protein
VRRSSDNVEQDIGFVNNYLDTVSLKTFIGANSAHVVTWYDQGGSALDATNATTGTQPVIMTSGAIHYKNNHVAINFVDASGSVEDFLSFPNWHTNTDTDVWAFTTYSVAHGSSFGFVLGSNPATKGLAIYHNGSNQYLQFTDRVTSGTSVVTGAGNYPNDIQVLRTAYADRTNMGIYENGILKGTASDPDENFDQPTAYYIGNANTGSARINAHISEILLYNTDKAALRTAIEGYINFRYTIY